MEIWYSLIYYQHSFREQVGARVSIDRRAEQREGLKSNIETIPNALEKVLNVRDVNVM